MRVWLEARCRTDLCRQKKDATIVSAHGRLLLRYLSGSLTDGGRIEVKCPRCNEVTVIVST